MGKLGRHDAKGRTRLQDRFTNIPNYVLASEAVRTLPAPAFKVMMYLAARCYGAKTNGQIVYGARSGCLVFNTESRRWEEACIGLSRSVTARALLVLQRRGLAVCTKASRFGQTKMTRTYRLTWVKSEDGPATNEFMGYRDPTPKPKPSPTSGTKARPIVPPAGQAPQDHPSKQAFQSHQRDYVKPLSPTSGTLSNQCNSNRTSDVSPMPVSTALLGTEVARRAAPKAERARAPAQTIDLSSVLAARLHRSDDVEHEQLEGDKR